MFKPVKEKSRREILIGLVEVSEPGKVITYQELSMLFDVDDKKAIQNAVNKSNHSIEASTKRALEAVPNVGYRVVASNEHYRLAVKHQRKGHAQLKRAMSKVENINFDELNSDERDDVIKARNTLSMQADFGRRSDIRTAKRIELESYLRASGSSGHSEIELSVMEDRIKRLEKLID